MKSTHKSGFTLIELLIVIAIISLLAAILFPVFGRARESARKSSCASNLKNIGIAWLMYAQDYDEKTVLVNGATVGTTTYYWENSWDSINGYDTSAGLIQPYMKSAKILDCPSAIGTIPIPTNSGNTVAYARNNDVNLIAGGYNNPVSLAQIEVVAETIIMADAAFRANTDGSLARARQLRPPSISFPTAHGRHNGFANILWFDGHVKAMKIEPRAPIADTAVKPDNTNWHRNNNIGDLLKPGCPAGSACQDYYFLAAKPAIP